MPGSHGIRFTFRQTPSSSCGQPQLDILVLSIQTNPMQKRAGVTAVTRRAAIFAPPLHLSLN
jgi:hypothetical protein